MSAPKPYIFDNADKFPTTKGTEYHDFNQHSKNGQFQELSVSQFVVVYIACTITIIVFGGILWLYAGNLLNSYDTFSQIAGIFIRVVIVLILLASTLTSFYIGVKAVYTQLLRSEVLFDAAHTPISVHSLRQLNASQLQDMHYEIQRILAANSASRGVQGSVYQTVDYPTGFEK